MRPLAIRQVYQRLAAAYGPQHWWPAESAFEVMVGAILTQNAAWTNVERAIANLKRADALTPQAILAASHDQLAEWLRPSGYYNIKARRLRNYCAWHQQQGGMEALERQPTATLRAQLLTINGVGAETADDILLYALRRPVFVVDAYTRRLFARLGHSAADDDYETLRGRFERALAGEADGVATFSEYHALIVQHAKQVCRKRPQCDACVLRPHCPAGRIAATPPRPGGRVTDSEHCAETR